MNAFQQDAYHLLANCTCFGVTTRCQYWWGSPQVNTFKQVSSDGHQISSAVGSPMSHIWVGVQESHVWCLARGQGQEACKVRSNASWVMITWDPPVDRLVWLTDGQTHENITFPQLCWWTVKMYQFDSKPQEITLTLRKLKFDNILDFKPMYGDHLCHNRKEKNLDRTWRVGACFTKGSFQYL